LISIYSNCFLRKKINEFILLETVFTCFPAFVLITIGIPTLKVLYNIEFSKEREIVVEIKGHQ